MDAISVGPLRVASLVWQPRPAARAFTLVVKATFSLRPGDAVLADEQEAVNDRDRHRDEKAGASVHAPSDLVPIKPRAEVMVVGHAFAPRKQPARSIVARLAVGEVNKRVEIFCERVMAQDGSIQEGGGFLRMPLVYERAAGGPGTWNPAGIRPDARDAYGRRMLPNLQSPGTVLKGISDGIEPVGLGPIAPSWPARIAKLGRHAHAFSSGPSWDRPLPEGIDLGYFNSVLADQQLGALHENERILLENLHPEHAQLVTILPGIRPAAFVDRGRGGERMLLRADTLWIDTDRVIATLTWRGQVPIEHADATGRVVVALESAARELTWAEVKQMTAPQRAGFTPIPAERDDETMPPPAVMGDNPLEGTMSLPGGAARASAAGPALPFARAGAAATAAGPLHGPPTVGLPFEGPASSLGQSSASWPAQPAPPPPRARMDSSPDWPAVAPAAPPAVHGRASDSSVFRAPAAPAPVPIAPAVIGPPVSDSPWAAGSPSSGPRETPGTAATAAAAWSPPSVAAASAPVIRSAPAPRARPDSRDTVLELIWFDPDAVPRLRRKPAFRTLLQELEQRPLDADLDDPAQAKDPAEMEDRREVFDILALGEATDPHGVNEALFGAVREDGKFVPPIVLLAGELSFVFDELETLKATLTTVTPLITPSDENLQRTCDLAKTFLQTPGLLSGPAVAEGLTSRIEDAFSQGKRMVPAGYLEQQVELALLGERHYKKRPIFGGPHLRTLLHLPGSSQPIPTYMVADIADKLPLYKRFRTRLLAEVRLQEDQSETHPTALRVVALGRLVPQPKK